jgi:hypothetical protein
MATETKVSHTGDAGILARLIGPQEDNLPPAAAKALLKIRFHSSDLDRIHELAVKNQDGTLTPAEKADLESDLRVSSFLDLMHAKARRSLKKHIPIRSPYANC